MTASGRSPARFAMPRSCLARLRGRIRATSRLSLPMRDRKSTRLNSSHTVIYTLSLHDALPIYDSVGPIARSVRDAALMLGALAGPDPRDEPTLAANARSEEHTSELQSHRDLHSFPTRRSSDL